MDCDVLIVGGGPVGAALALGLRRSRYRVLVLEARQDPAASADPRALALSYGTSLLLRRLEIWDRLPTATPIEAIHVSSKGQFGRSVLTAGDAGVPVLGYVTNYRDLVRVMHGALLESGVEYVAGASVSSLECNAEQSRVRYARGGEPREGSARLVVLSDGGRLASGLEGVKQRERDYGQWAVVAEVAMERASRHTAYERFTRDGPVALLPFGERFALVWTVPAGDAPAVLGLADADFLEKLSGHFGGRLGRFTYAGPRAGFPLSFRETDAWSVPRLLLLGNAAHTLHPVAGQGFNLGLRDAWELAEMLPAWGGDDPGAGEVRDRFRARRRLDMGAGAFFTDSIVRLFSNSDPLLAPARGFALSLLDMIPPAKRFLSRRMMFGARG
jgi:2-octaprenyl-6-methoxyphenol hydroxylase